MSEPEVALAFTADPWVEELHRHLADHGGARVRTVVVEPALALDESYDVLVAGHRWPALTRAFVTDVHARGRAVLGVYDREEAESRPHVVALGVDAVVESDASPSAFVAAIAAVRREPDGTPASAPAEAPRRGGRLVVVGGAPGVGRTEVAVQLAVALARHTRTALVDADDVAPAVATRLALPIEPNVRTAIDAVEHGRGELALTVVVEPRSGLRVVTGVPNPSAWAHIRPGEVVRVIDRLADDVDIVVADGAGVLEAVGPSARGRFAIARALVVEADAIVAVCDASPVGVARVLAWAVDATALAPGTPMLAVVNRAPSSRFHRGELFEELHANLPLVDVVFVATDPRVADAAWNGTTVGRGPFTRAMQRVAEIVDALPRRAASGAVLEAAS